MTVPQSRPGFTLIELLVVIAILSLLISVLLPSLARVKDAARQVLCANNLKELSVAISNYCMDQGRYLPIYTIPPPRDRGANWHRNIWPYIEANGTHENWGDRYSAVINSKGSWIYQCPSAVGGDEYFSFGMNQNLFDERTQMSPDLLLLMDWVGISLAWGMTNQLLVRLPGWHMGETNNLLFEDGHLENRTLDELPGREEDRRLWYHQ